MIVVMPTVNECVLECDLNSSVENCDCFKFLITFVILYRVIRNDCRGFNNLSYTIHLRQGYMCFFLFNKTTFQVFVTYFTGALYVHRL